MKKLVFITILPVPYHIKFCNELQQYFDTEFWFYTDRFEKNVSRPAWWKTDLGDKCRILKNVAFTKSKRYLTLNIISELNRFNPDIVMFGGFIIPSNYLAYLWAKRHDKKAVAFVERSRNKTGELRKMDFSRRIMNFLYRKIDLVTVPSDDSIPQYRDEFRFGGKVVMRNYPMDITAYYKHAFRTGKEAYVYLFPNRLFDIYNPLLAIEIFHDVLKKYPDSRLLMNTEGYLHEKCIELIKRLDITGHVEFLDSIKSWEELPQVYERSDIMIFPAIFSNGNVSIFEAMASGMGVIISNRILGFSGAFIVDGENGFKCEPEKSEFLKRIENYIKEPGLFQKHALINRERVKPLTIEETAKRTYKVLTDNLNY